MRSIKSARRGEKGSSSGSKKSLKAKFAREIYKRKSRSQQHTVKIRDKEIIEEVKFGPWSDWFWSQDYQVFYKGRKDMNDMWDYEYDFKVPKREIPRFVPPIKIEYMEGEKVDLIIAQPGGERDEYTWVVGLCEDIRISKVEEEGGAGNVKDLDINGKEMKEKAKELRKDLGKRAGVISDVHKEHEGKSGGKKH